MARSEKDCQIANKTGMFQGKLPQANTYTPGDFTNRIIVYLPQCMIASLSYEISSAPLSVEPAVDLGLGHALKRLDEGRRAERNLLLGVDLPDGLEGVRHLTVKLPESDGESGGGRG